MGVDQKNKNRMDLVFAEYFICTTYMFWTTKKSQRKDSKIKTKIIEKEKREEKRKPYPHGEENSIVKSLWFTLPSIFQPQEVFVDPKRKG